MLDKQQFIKAAKALKEKEQKDYAVIYRKFEYLIIDLKPYHTVIYKTK